MTEISYTNAFGEPATDHDLRHIFQQINTNNDERIVFREFTTIVDDVGLAYTRDRSRALYDVISDSSQNCVTKDSFMQGAYITNSDVQEFFSKMLNGGQYEFQEGRQEMELSELSGLLANYKADWKARRSGMQSVVRQLTAPTTTLREFQRQFGDFVDLILVQSKDRRTAVMHAATEALGKIIRYWRNETLRYASQIVEGMFELIRQRVEICQMSGSACVRCVIRNVPDSKRFQIMETLGNEANASRYQDLKIACFQFLCVYIDLSAEEIKTDSFWRSLMIFVEQGVSEPAVTVRDPAMWVLMRVKRVRPALTQPVIDAMNNHLRIRFERDFDNAPADEIPDFGATEAVHSRLEDDEDEKDGDVASPGGRRKKKKKKKKRHEPPPVHARKRTWTADDLRAGAQGMAVKMSTRNLLTTTERKEPERRQSPFKRPPPGTFFNPFSERVQDMDITYAFDKIDTKADRYITADEFHSALEALQMETTASEEQKMFNLLDINKESRVNLETFKQVVNNPPQPLHEVLDNLLAARIYEMPPQPGDMDLDTIRGVIETTDADWEQRVTALIHFTRKAVVHMNKERFDDLFKRMCQYFLIQLADGRSAVSRETCIAFAKIMIARKSAFLRYAPRVCEGLNMQIRIKIEVISISAVQCQRVLIRYVPDNRKFLMFQQLTQASAEKRFEAVRKAAFESINMILIRMFHNDQARPAKFWNLMTDALNAGLHDSKPVVRDLAYAALIRIELMQETPATKALVTSMTKKLSRAKRKKYDEIKQQVLQDLETMNPEDDNIPMLIIRQEPAERTPGPVSPPSRTNRKAQSPRDARGRGGGAKRNSRNPSSGSTRGGGRSGGRGGRNDSSPAKRRSQNRLPTSGSGTRARASKSPNPKKSNGVTRSSSGRSNRGGRSSNNSSSKRTSGSSNTSERRNGSRRGGRPAQVEEDNGDDAFEEPATEPEPEPEPVEETPAATEMDDIPEYDAPAEPEMTEVDEKQVDESPAPGSGTSSGRSSQTLGTKVPGRGQRRGSGMVRPRLVDATVEERIICDNDAMLQAFRDADVDRDGKLSFQEFCSAMDALGIPYDQNKVRRAYSELEVNPADLIDLETYVNAIHLTYPHCDMLWNDLWNFPYQESEYLQLEEMPTHIDDFEAALQEWEVDLTDPEAPWKDRTKAMRVLVAVVTNRIGKGAKPAKTTGGAKKQKYSYRSALFALCADSFGEAIRGIGHPIVVREACVSLARVARCLKKEMLDSKKIGRLFEHIWNGSMCNVELIKFSTSRCSMTIFKYVPDSSSFSLLQLLSRGVFLSGPQYRSLILQVWDCFYVYAVEQTSVRKSSEVWKIYRQAISKQIVVKNGDFANNDAELLERCWQILAFWEESLSSQVQALLEHDVQRQAFERFKGGKQPPEQRTQAVLTRHTRTLSGWSRTLGEPQIAVNSARATPITAPPRREVPRPAPVSVPAAAAQRPNRATNLPLPGSGRVESVRNRGAGARARAFSAVYSEHEEQLKQMFNDHDKSKKGHLSAEEASVFLDEMGVGGNEKEVTMRGLDRKSTGRFHLEAVMKWCFWKSPELRPNPVLEEEAIGHGWLTLPVERLQERLLSYGKLLELEREDDNLLGIFDAEHQIGLLEYLMEKRSSGGGGAQRKHTANSMGMSPHHGPVAVEDNFD